MQLRLPPDFPAKPARVHVGKPFFLKLPHVEHDGSLCLPDTSSPGDYDDPVTAVLLVIQNFEKQWVPMCSDPQRIQEEFQKECLSYWSNYCSARRQSANKLLAATWTYLDLSPITSCVEGEIVAYVQKLPNNRARITRQVVTAENGDPASIASRHGWGSGTLVQGKALFVPLPDDVPWTPQTWPQDFTTLEKLVTGLTSGEVELTSWVQSTPSEKEKGSSKARGKNKGKRRHYPAHPDSICAHPFVVVLVQGSVPFLYQITRGPIRGQVAKCGDFSIFPIEPTRIDTSWSLTRDHAPEPFEKRQQKKVLVIGCGSLGSPIVELLARAGVGSLDIVDSERFDSPNVSRHVLGLASLGRAKAEALAARLRQDIPGLQITGYQARVAEWLARVENHKEYDLVVECTGESSVRTVLSQWRPLAFGNTPVLHAWLEPYCSAAHVILTLADDPWPASDPADDKVNAADFSGFDIRVDLPACGAGFHPYGAADAWQGAAFASERIIAVLDGQCPQATVWSWVRTKAFYDTLPVPGQVPLRTIVPLEGSRYDSVMRTRDYRSVMGAP
ncbi:ThiF family adenylyltransferase [Castellaniella sp.]|uniref:ThiF family adenylyltransferase n=1 Tax=Castellaniella sp. TaxID=1955812 RepID=UPI002AFF8564|nr:ThiF family adenylyltransferase [Castellaniella sp.]